MSNIQLATHIDNEEDVFATILALRSLQCLEQDLKPVIALASQKTIDEFEEKYPDIQVAPIFRKLGGNLITAFPKGYNWNLGFRPAMAQIVRRVEDGDGLLYFSPRTIFYGKEFLDRSGETNWMARQPDDFWPKRELYGPSLTEIWRTIAELGGGTAEAWFDPEFPEEYWRRYPAGSPHLFYTPDPKALADILGKINTQLIEQPPTALQGQGHAPKEALIPASFIQLGGSIIDPEWDFDLVYYQDFYELLLRLNDEHAVWFHEEIMEFPIVRRVFKSVEEYRLIFYQKRIGRIRDGLDFVERNFSPMRMQQLIQRRNIRSNIKKRIRAQTQHKLL